MDTLQIFNDELQSLLSSKPPVSKAKMGLITRAAMKGVKFYKDIVMSVEKFIQRSRSEYKVPGLYVIDSIVRQSRHQFGVERDFYANRFARNLPRTFESLFNGCLPEDKPKIVRVLNLWQKNGVFSVQTIEPLMQMAEETNGSNSHRQPSSRHHSHNHHHHHHSSHLNRRGDLSSAASPPMENNSKSGNSSYNHYESGSSRSTNHHDLPGSAGGLKFSKNMLDFDYDEDDDDNGDETPTEAEPPLSSTLNKLEMEHRGRQTSQQQHSTHQCQQQQQQQSQAQYQQPQNPQYQPDPVLERWNRILRGESSNEDSSLNNNSKNDMSRGPTRRSRSRSPKLQPPGTYLGYQQSGSATGTSISRNNPTSATTTTTTVVTTRSSSSHRSETTSSTADHQKQHSSSSSRDRSSREAERLAEREKKCLPKIRDKHLTVCSSTLWLGHVPKSVTEADLSNAFGEYGTITSIDLIPPRGCAYVCMDRRQDAKRALNESKDLKLNGSHIKMAWAPGKGFKEYRKLKDFWEVETGSSYIPYSRVDDTIDFEVLEEGGVIDEDSMSMEMRERRELRQKEKQRTLTDANQDINQDNNGNTNPSIPMPALPLLNQPPPSSSGGANIAPFAIPPLGHLGHAPPMLHFSHPQVMPTIVSSAGAIGPIPAVPGSMNSIPSLLNGGGGSNMIKQNDSLGGPDNGDNNTANGDNDRDDAEQVAGSSPSNIDQQLSMTERQISMVEQQLNMIKQAHNIAGSHGNAAVVNVTQANNMHQQQQQQPPPAVFHPAAIASNQPNPMIFDMPLHPHHPLLPMGGPPQTMLDPNIFINPAQLLGPAQFLGLPPPSMGQPIGMMDPENMQNPMLPQQPSRF